MVTRLARVGKELAALRAIAMFFGGQEVMQLTIYIYICTVHTVHSIPLRSIVLHGSTWPAYIRHIDLYHSISISKPISFLYPSIFIYIYISVLHVCRCLVTWMEIPIGRPLWVIELEQQLYHQIETKRNSFSYKWGEGFDSHLNQCFCWR